MEVKTLKRAGKNGLAEKVLWFGNQETKAHNLCVEYVISTDFVGDWDNGRDYLVDAGFETRAFIQPKLEWVDGVWVASARILPEDKYQDAFTVTAPPNDWSTHARRGLVHRVYKEYIIYLEGRKTQE